MFTARSEIKYLATKELLSLPNKLRHLKIFVLNYNIGFCLGNIFVDRLAVNPASHKRNNQNMFSNVDMKRR